MKNLSSMTDEELAMLYTEGNNAAFDLLLERNQSKLYSYILFVVHDEHLANDIFQDTFFKAIVKLHEGKYTPSGKFGAWLTRIAHNLIMDSYRDYGHYNIVETNPENDLSNISNGNTMEASYEGMMINDQVMEDVKRIMTFLPQEQREVVYMRFYQDMSFKDIAQTTGVSINTSLGRMRYAIINMRRLAAKHNIALNLT